MHDKLFASQQALQPTDLKRYAEDIRLDARVFAECLDSWKMTPDWERDKADGERLGIASTPVMFVNGIPILGAVPLEEMVQIVEDELNRLGRSGPASQSWDAAAQKR